MSIEVRACGNCARKCAVYDQHTGEKYSPAELQLQIERLLTEVERRMWKEGMDKRGISLVCDTRPSSCNLLCTKGLVFTLHGQNGHVEVFSGISPTAAGRAETALTMVSTLRRWQDSGRVELEREMIAPELRRNYRGRVLALGAPQADDFQSKRLKETLLEALDQAGLWARFRAAGGDIRCDAAGNVTLGKAGGGSFAYALRDVDPDNPGLREVFIQLVNEWLASAQGQAKLAKLRADNHPYGEHLTGRVLPMEERTPSSATRWEPGDNSRAA